MKAFKVISITIVSFLIVLYSAFLFILPNMVNLEQYAPSLISQIQKNTGFQVYVEGLQVKTAWNLAIGAHLKRLDLKYPTGEKFAQINDLDVRLSLLPLLVKKITLDSVGAESVIANLEVEKSGKFILEQYFPKQDKNQAKNPQEIPFGFQFSKTMPDVYAKKYKISFIDTATKSSYVVKGADFKISDFILDKKVKVRAKGALILKGRPQVDYDLALFSKVLNFAVQQGAQPSQAFNIINIFEDLYKYNTRASIIADLKISGEADNPDINGDINLNNILFTLDGSTLPKSSLDLRFKGDKVKIKSYFYTDINEKALITGVFNNGRKKSIDLRVQSNKTDIGNTLLIANTLLELANIKDLQGVSANGHLSADFYIKSDFKHITSGGYLKIDNANIIHNIYKAQLKSIFADIDFSQNEIDIKKASALINGEMIHIKGSIDRNANANINILANNLQLRGLLAAVGQLDVLRDNDINSGVLDIVASIKGRLDKTAPTIDVELKNLNMRNKPNKAQIHLSNAKIKMVSNGKQTKGKTTLIGLKVSSQGKNILANNVGVSFDEKDLKIDNGTLFLNNSKIDIFGQVKNYSDKKIKYDITARGLILASDIKSMLAKENQKGVVARGKIPLLVRITGSDKQKIHAQMLANNTNNISIFDISSLRGKTSLINAELYLSGSDLDIDEITLYSIFRSGGLSSNMDANIGSGQRVVSVSGKISNINALNPYIDSLSVKIPSQISTSIPGFVNSSVSAKGNLNISGNASNPVIRGGLVLPHVSIPSLKVTLADMALDFNSGNIKAVCPSLNISNSQMAFSALMDDDMSKGILIKNLDFNAQNIDLDSLGAALSNMPQNANGPGTDLGVTILGGKASIQRVKTGGIVATAVNSSIGLRNNVLKLDDLRAKAYLGDVAGTVTYNLIYNKVGLDLQGRTLSAEPALKGVTGMPQVPSGRLDFDTDLTLVGFTPEQMMQSMKGSLKFMISNGQMGKLGQLEHLLNAQNILSNNIFKATLNVIAKALTLKNTGNFKYIKGEMTFNSGWANLAYIKTSGPSMSMYITGRYNILNNNGSLIILGRLSNDVLRVLGPLGELSVDKVLSYIPKVGAITSALINQMTTSPELENVSMIPSLTPATSLDTREFKVVINGDLNSQRAVKSFKWLANPTAQVSKSTSESVSYPQINQSVQNLKQHVQNTAQEALSKMKTTTPSLPSSNTNTGQKIYQEVKKQIPVVPDFVDYLPDFKN